MTKNRIIIIGIITFICFFIMIIKLSYMQLHNTKASIKNLNKLSIKTVYGPSMPRGRIYDRNYNVIVDNIATNMISYKKESGMSNKDEIELAYNLSKHIELEYSKLTDRNLREFWIVNNMNLANKITMSRIVLAIVIMILLLFPFEGLGLDLPTYLVNGNIYIEFKYIIAGVLFIIASLTDFVDGRVARKYNMVTDFGKMVDAISDKMLTNSLLVILSANGMISPVIAVIFIVRDIAVDTIKMIVGNKGKAVAAIGVAKLKTATLMVGLTLTLFYNLPFELIGIRVSDCLLIISAILSLVSGFIEFFIRAILAFIVP